MSGSTVIVQHVASVAIFCCCFVAIFQERVEPLAVVGGASLCTLLGWVLWDYWMGEEEREEAARNTGPKEDSQTGKGGEAGERQEKSEGKAEESDLISGAKGRVGASYPNSPTYPPQYVDPASSLSPRNQQRLATVKSALLIYAALLGLSPILKSLTKSTTSDSIWALSTWLLCMNVAFFDYGSGSGSQ